MVRLVLLAQCAALFTACGSPIVHPRRVDVREGVRLGRDTSYPVGEGRITLRAPPGYMPVGDEPTAEEVERRVLYGHATSHGHSIEHPGLRLLSLLMNGQLSGALAPVDGVEAGAWINFERIGAELRAQPLHEAWGAPFSVAPSIAVMHGSLFGTWHAGFRGGIDISKRAGDFELLLGGFVSRERRRRDISASGVPDDGEGHVFPGEFIGPGAVRDETNLLIPFGLAIPIDESWIILGAVPEIVLHSSIVSLDCRKTCAGFDVATFEHDFSIHLTVGFSSETLVPWD